jgi:disulfide bond formation protein DsbB
MPEAMSSQDERQDARVLRAWQVPALIPEATSAMEVPLENLVAATAQSSGSRATRALIAIGWIVAVCLLLYALIGLVVLLVVRNF